MSNEDCVCSNGKKQKQKTKYLTAWTLPKSNIKIVEIGKSIFLTHKNEQDGIPILLVFTLQIKLQCTLWYCVDTI